MNTYHYCIRLSNYFWKEPKYFDGIITWESDVFNESEYQKLKKELQRKHDTESNNSTNIVVINFNAIGK